MGRHGDLKGYGADTQIIGGWYKAAETYLDQTGRDLAQDSQDPARYPAIVKALSKVWPSLPGARQRHAYFTQDDFARSMNRGRGKSTPAQTP